MKCDDCGHEWTGQKQGHCTRCHRTFSCDTNFDAHLIIERGPGVYKVVGCKEPADLLDKEGSPRFRYRANGKGTPIVVGRPMGTP